MLPLRAGRRFQIVTGKGGVGKSAVTALLAHLNAAAGRRTLVCELNTRERIPRFFGLEPVGDRIGALRPNLYSVNIRPRAALEEYALMKLRFRSLVRLVFENRLVRRFVEFVPGMNELLMLGKAFNHERERDGDGELAWDCILIDAPATGNGVTLLRLPQVIATAVPGGNMHDEAAAMWALLQDPDRTAVHLVTLPEELPIQETRELAGTLFDEMGLPPGYLFFNQMPITLLDEAQRAAFSAAFSTRPENPQLRALWTATSIRLGREDLARSHQHALDDLALPRLELPMLHASAFGGAQIERLAEAALAAAAQLEGRR